jgi:hypothetical protein
VRNDESLYDGFFNPLRLYWPLQSHGLRPHSVAWISHWFAEPVTRVRIAAGPPFTLNHIFQDFICQPCSVAIFAIFAPGFTAIGFPVIRINHVSAIVFP